MNVQEVADYLRVTRKTVYRLLGRDGIPATRIGRQWRFKDTTIDDWLNGESAKARADILVIDDEKVIRMLFKDVLEELGHSVTAVKTGSEGLELVEQRDFALVFLDLKMPGMDGAEIFRRIKVIRPALPVTIITGYPDSDLMARALAQGPFGMMNKPFGESDIIMAVNTFLGITQPGR